MPTQCLSNEGGSEEIRKEIKFKGKLLDVATYWPQMLKNNIEFCFKSNLSVQVVL